MFPARPLFPFERARVRTYSRYNTVWPLNAPRTMALYTHTSHAVTSSDDRDLHSRVLRPHLLWCERHGHHTYAMHQVTHARSAREGRGAGRAIPSVCQDALRRTCPKVMNVAWEPARRSCMWHGLPSVRPAAPRVGVRSSSRDRVALSAEGSHPFCLDASEGLGRPVELREEGGLDLTFLQGRGIRHGDRHQEGE